MTRRKAVRSEAEWLAALRELLEEGAALGHRPEPVDIERLRALAAEDEPLSETHARHEGRTTFAWTTPAAALLSGDTPWTALQRQLTAALATLGADGVAWVAPPGERVAVILTTDVDVENGAANRIARELAGGRSRFRRIGRDAIGDGPRFPVLATNAGVPFQVIVADGAMRLALDADGELVAEGVPEPTGDDFVPGLPRVRVTGAL